MTDSITILRSIGGLKLTKTWRADGTISDYDSPKNFKVEQRPVADIHELSALLTKLESRPDRCVIRGVYDPVPEGTVVRTLEATVDRPHHWMLLDVDKFEPMLSDPVEDPLDCIHEFIQTHLPPEFFEASFHWQLSASAGAEKNRGKLKAHLWFFSETAYDSESMSAWARSIGHVDQAVMRQVQVHYTAAPVIEPGADCPVGTRSGFYQGMFCDAVPLVLDPALLAAVAARTRVDRHGMVDPTLKPGLVGLFCRLYPPERVVQELLPDQFEFSPGSDRRITWLQGGGSPEGVFITDDELHLANTHNTDPFHGRAANCWDFVRVHKFGHLDDAADELDTLEVTRSPSQLAMMRYAEGLNDVAAARGEAAEAELSAAAASDEPVPLPEAAALKEARLSRVLEKIRSVGSSEELKTVLAPKISAAEFDSIERAQLAREVQVRLKALTQTKVSIAECRALVSPPPAARAAGAPSWLDGWLLLTPGDKFIEPLNLEMHTRAGFDGMFNRRMPRTDAGPRESAARWAIDEWEIPQVHRLLFAPPMPALFKWDGVLCANTYRPDLVPDEPDSLDHAGRLAVGRVLAHLERFLPDQRERELLISWMAHNVRFPGRRIRWAPYVCGTPGNGKSFLADLMAAAMGSRNVSRLDSGPLRSEFNAWAVGSAVVVLEEVRQPGRNPWELAERMKTLITNNEISVHAKGLDPYMAPNFSNYLLLSNHLAGMPVDNSDRRYFFVKSPITEDEARSMAETGHFGELFQILGNYGPALRRWLMDVQLHAEFDPNGRAPITAARAEVVEASRSGLEDAAESLIEQGGPGFGPEVVSSARLTAAVAEVTGDKPRTLAVKLLLEKLGFQFWGRLKWGGETHRVWCRNNKLTPDEVRAALDASDADNVLGDE